MMTPNEYQEAALTTQNYETTIIYPSLGLVGEGGEVAEKIKKLHRDFGWNVSDKVPKDHRKEIALELGDVCWYAAVLASDLGHKLSGLISFDELPVESGSIPMLVVHLNVACSKVSQFAITEEKLNIIPFRMLFVFINSIAHDLGFSIYDILEMNIIKLRSRKERGVISGNGDFR